MMNRTTQRPTGAELVEKIVTKGNRARIRDRQARTIADACWCCGDRPNTDHRYPRRPVGKSAVVLGMEGKGLYVVACTGCAEAERRVRGRHEVTGMTGRRSVEAAVVADRLDQIRPGFRPDGFTIRPRHLPALTWAAVALDFPGVDPPHGNPFDHLPREWETIDFGPAPTPPPPPPTDPRLIEPGCLFCGMPTPEGERFGPEGEYFGLPKVKGIKAARVRGRFCGPCGTVARNALANGIHGKRPGVWVGWALTRRLERERPDLLPANVGKGDKVLPRSGVRSRSWAAHVIDRREAGDSEPIPPSTPFGWLP